jgi:hypothetical protein
MEADSAALTVSFTAWFNFCALNTSMSIASCNNKGKLLECEEKLEPFINI